MRALYFEIPLNVTLMLLFAGFASVAPVRADIFTIDDSGDVPTFTQTGSARQLDLTFSGCIPGSGGTINEQCELFFTFDQSQAHPLIPDSGAFVRALFQEPNPAPGGVANPSDSVTASWNQGNATQSANARYDFSSEPPEGPLDLGTVPPVEEHVFTENGDFQTALVIPWSDGSSDTIIIRSDLEPVPEPSAILLLISALAILCGKRLHLLGLDHKKLTYRYAGRDFRLTDVHGNVVHDILA